MFSILIKQNAATAKLVSRNQTPYLLATFHTSTPPMIWQMDLEKSTSFTVSLREKEGEWDIGYTPSQGEYVVVAHFDERGDAQNAYDVVQKALSQNAGNASGGFGILKFILFLALLAVLFFAASAALSLLGDAPSSEPKAGLSSLGNTSEKVAKPGEMRLGVPVTADDVLSQRP
ncbi:MAG TPA: hypothetical protein DCY07_06210 [Rhodospirillaceae bacterium]|nr:hypothetical protein [Rhodospirillaceae bacterium]